VSVTQNRYGVQRQERLPRKGSARRMQGDLEDSGRFYRCRVCGWICDVTKTVVSPGDTQDFRDGGNQFSPFVSGLVTDNIGDFDISEGWYGGFQGDSAITLNAMTDPYCIQSSPSFVRSLSPQNKVWVDCLFYIDNPTMFRYLSIILIDGLSNFAWANLTVNPLAGFNDGVCKLSDMTLFGSVNWGDIEFARFDLFSIPSFSDYNATLYSSFIYENEPKLLYEPIAQSGCPMCGSMAWK
jgi:hypothetical protein